MAMHEHHKWILSFYSLIVSEWFTFWNPGSLHKYKYKYVYIYIRTTTQITDAVPAADMFTVNEHD